MKDLKIQELTSGINNQDLANSYYNIANVYKSLQLNENAIEYFNKCLSIKLKSGKSSENFYQFINIYHSMGLVYKAKQDLSSAIKYFKDSLRLKMKYLDKQDPTMALSYGVLAQSFLNMNQLDKAIEYTQKELEIYVSANGENDISVLNCRQRFASIYLSLGSYESALDNLLKCRIILVSIPSVQRSN